MSLGFFVLQKNDGKHTFTESRYLIGEQKNGEKKERWLAKLVLEGFLGKYQTQTRWMELEYLPIHEWLKLMGSIK